MTRRLTATISLLLLAASGCATPAHRAAPLPAAPAPPQAPPASATAAVTLLPPPAAVPAVQPFATAESLSRWSFSNGPEWPGATGALTWQTGAGRDADGAAALSYNFEKGGNYVAAIADLPADPPVRAVRLWVNKPAANLVTFRAVDQDGETFQKNLRFDYRGWQQIEVSFDGWVHHWGGDGQYRGPARQFHVLVENDGGNRTGTLLLDDVEWLSDPPAANAAGAARTVYTESDFTESDGWSCADPENGSLAGGEWSYAFATPSSPSTLLYHRGILGRPTALRLVLDSDGSGHELTVRIASHFQLFERSLGTLDQPGPVTLEAPLGDLTTWRHFGGEDDGVVRYPLQLVGLSLHRRGDADRGLLKLQRIEFVTDFDRPTETVSLVPSVSAGHRESLNFRVALRSLAAEPLPGTLLWSLHAVDRPVNAGQERLTLPPGGRPVSTGIPAAFDGLTVVEARFQFVADTVVSPQVSTTIAQPPPADYDRQLDPASRLGAGLYLYRYHGRPDAREALEQTCDLAARAGVKWTREEFNWNMIEPVRGQYDFAFFDQLVETAHAHGISVYALCCYYTDWTGRPLTDEFIEPYCTYLRTLVNRYQDRIHHWEIWNEPNIFFWPGPKELYPRLLRRAYETIKEADPQAQVLGCSTAGIDVGFIKMVQDQGGPFDALTIHPYRGELDTAGFIRELRDVRALTGGKDVWITEMGWPSHIGGLSERQQAGYVARTYLSALASGAIRNVSWYDFREDGRDPYFNEHHFGLVRADLTPKIGYRTLAAVGQLLAAAEFDCELELGPDAAGFAFRQGSRHVAAIWSTTGTQLWRLAVQPPDCTVLNAVNEPADCVLRDGALTIRLEAGLPVYLTADQPLTVQPRPAPISLQLNRPSIHPGEFVEVDCQADADTIVGRLSPPPGWKASATRPQEAFTVTAPAWCPPGPFVIVVPVECEGKTFEIPLTVPVVPALLRS